MCSFITANAETGVAFSVGSAVVDFGEKEATVALSLTENSGHAGADFTVDTDLKLLKVEEVSVSAMYGLSSKKINWSYANDKKMTGTVLKLTFQIPEDATSDSTWEIGLTVNKLVDSAYQSVPYTVSKGTISMRKITGLTLTSAPVKLTYTVGDTLDTTGLVLSATYDGTSAKTVTEGYTCSPSVFDKAGTQTVTVTYGGLSVAFSVTVNSGRLVGDANNDGSVTVKDAVMIRRWLVGGWNVTINEDNADVDGDSCVTVKDVILIRRYLSEDWDVSLNER